MTLRPPYQLPPNLSFQLRFNRETQTLILLSPDSFILNPDDDESSSSTLDQPQNPQNPRTLTLIFNQNLINLKNPMVSWWTLDRRILSQISKKIRYNPTQQCIQQKIILKLSGFCVYLSYFKSDCGILYSFVHDFLLSLFSFFFLQVLIKWGLAQGNYGSNYEP